MTLRTRNKGALDRSWTRVRDYYPPPGGALQSDTGVVFGSIDANGEYQTTSDVSTPDYLKRKAKGEIFMNYFHTVKQKRTCSAVSFTLGPNPAWGSRKWDGTLAAAYSVSPVRPAWFDQRKVDAESRTLLQAHSKVASESFLGLVTVAEAAKTAKIVARPFGAARDLVNRIAARKLKLISKGLTVGAAATTAWLEYRFGWKPILYDIQGIKEAYVNNLVWFDKPKRLVARASDAEITWESNTVNTTPIAGTSGSRRRHIYSHRARVSSGVLYELRDESLEHATARRMGLRLEDVPSSVWELVPFSFVVDRFIDVGLWLSAITPKPGVSVLGSWTTNLDYQVNTTVIDEMYVEVGSPLTHYGSPGGTFVEELTGVRRIANPPLPSLPTVNYRDLNLVQQIDHLALTIALLTGLKVPKS